MSEMTIERIEQIRRQSTKAGIVGLLCLAIFLWILYVVYYLFADHRPVRAAISSIPGIFFGLSGSGCFLFSYRSLSKARAHFYGRRYASALLKLKAEGYNLGQISNRYALSYWEFWRSDNLEQFERSLFDYLHSFRRAQDLVHRQAKWAAANRQLREQLLCLFDEFQLPNDERLKLLKDFSPGGNPLRLKEFIESFRSREVHRRWVKMNSAPKTYAIAQPSQEVPSEENLRLRSLEVQASKVVSDSAKSFYQEALNTDSRRGKIRLFKRALSEDIRMAEIEGGLLAFIDIDGSPLTTAVAKVKHLSLQTFARERLSNMQLLVPDADWRMCREIVLALARPGQAGGRFHNHCLAEDTLKLIVRRQCEIYADIQFEPTVFQEAVRGLLRQGVLMKPRGDGERTLSLSTKVKSAATIEAAQIIASVWALKREMSGLPS